jgi:hypothetical protein
MWIDSEALVAKIENGELDFRQLMHNQENKSKALVSEQARFFAKPAYLEEKFIQIINEVKTYSERLLKDKEYYRTKTQDSKERVDEAVDLA